MHWQEILLRMVTAMVMGMLIGLDRERHGKPAGIKTFALVSLGAATFTLISIQMVEMAPDNLPQGYDPVRLVAGRLSAPLAWRAALGFISSPAWPSPACCWSGCP